MFLREPGKVGALAGSQEGQRREEDLEGDQAESPPRAKIQVRNSSKGSPHQPLGFPGGLTQDTSGNRAPALGAIPFGHHKA